MENRIVFNAISSTSMCPEVLFLFSSDGTVRKKRATRSPLNSTVAMSLIMDVHLVWGEIDFANSLLSAGADCAQTLQCILVIY